MKNINDELAGFLNRGDLLRSVLLLGKVEDTRFSINPTLDRIMSLASRVWNMSSGFHGDPVLMIHTVNKVLFEQQKLQAGPESSKRVIDDPKRYYLHHVLSHKNASPLSAAILYSAMCEQVGIHHECLALPNHYFIRIMDDVGDFYVDPFDRGRMMNGSEFQRRFRSTLQRHRMMQANLFERVGTVELVSRLAHQLKQVHILKGQALEALQAVEVLKGLHPESPEITRDRGILYCEMEYFSKAMDDLKTYLKQRPHAEDRADIKKLTQMLRGYQEIVN